MASISDFSQRYSNKTNFNQELDENYEREFKKTIETWPLKYISPRDIRRSGLLYIGTDDMLKCFYCNAEFGDWEEGDDPISAHKILVPECTFAKNVESLKLSVSKKPPAHMEKAQLNIRLESFTSFPAALIGLISQIALAGFFYTGIGDRVTCYYCGGQLKDWGIDEDPWVEHAYYFPGCKFVQLIKGKEFIENVQKNGRNWKIENVEESTTPPPKTLAQLLNEKCEICQKPEEQKGVKEMCYTPCGHIVSCEKCSIYEDKCKSCSLYIVEAIKVYNS